jgi:hypothetical protein
MPSRYDASTQAEAIRLVREHAGDYSAQWAAITAVSSPGRHEGHQTRSAWGASVTGDSASVDVQDLAGDVRR